MHALLEEFGPELRTPNQGPYARSGINRDDGITLGSPISGFGPGAECPAIVPLWRSDLSLTGEDGQEVSQFFFDFVWCGNRLRDLLTQQFAVALAKSLH